MSNKSGLPDSGPAQQADPNGWLGTETLQTRFGDFQFKDGYPLGDAAQRLLDLQSSIGRPKSFKAADACERDRAA
jgi:hypothetical protein